MGSSPACMRISHSGLRPTTPRRRRRCLSAEGSGPGSCRQEDIRWHPRKLPPVAVAFACDMGWAGEAVPNRTHPGEPRWGYTNSSHLRPPDLERLRRRIAADKAAETAAEAATRWWDSLQASADAAMTNVALDELLGDLLSAVRALLGVDTVSVLVANEAGDLLLARGSVGLSETASTRVRIPSGSGMAGRVMASRSPLVVDDLSTVGCASPFLRESGVRSVAAVPILDDQRVLGVLHAGSRQLGHFHVADTEILSAVADRLAAAMRRVSCSSPNAQPEIGQS